MKNIEIISQEEVRDQYELADLLRHIANCIENCNGSPFQQGFYPHWVLNVQYKTNEENVDNSLTTV